MKYKIFNLLLIVTSLFGYLEWGKNNHAFLFQAEGEVLFKIFTDLTSVINPFTIIPLAGQILLLITLFQKSPGSLLTYFGIAGLGILMVFILIIGLLGGNLKIFLSAIPFIFISVITIVHLRKMRIS